MAYFNPISYFIKSFIRLFTRKFFWVLLVLFCIFLGFIIFGNDGVFAETINTGKYGNYTGFSFSDISKFNSIIEDYKGNYDSFLARTIYNSGSGYTYSVSFFNIADIGNLYVTNSANSWNRFYYLCYSQYSGTNFFYHISLNSNFEYVRDDYSNSFGLALSTYDYSIVNSFAVYTNRIIYTNNNYNTVFFNGGDKSIVDVAPYFITTDEELETFDFDYLQINGGTTKYTAYYEPLDMTTTAEFKLTYVYKGVSTNIDILPEYVAVNTEDNTWQINIPYNVLTNKVIVRNGEEFYYIFKYSNGYESGYEFRTSFLTYDLTSQQEQDINADSEKQLQGQILETQQQTNDKLDNLDSTINNSNIDNITSDTLPSDDTQDITASGVNGIFTSIYNAFCTGNAQDIVFPIPFTNKNITLQANYVNNMLSSNGAGWVVTIIQAFWWYLISRFIIKDVMDKINKIKSGNIEDIETTNIRGDML